MIEYRLLQVKNFQFQVVLRKLEQPSLETFLKIREFAFMNDAAKMWEFSSTSSQCFPILAFHRFSRM